MIAKKRDKKRSSLGRQGKQPKAVESDDKLGKGRFDLIQKFKKKLNLFILMWSISLAFSLFNAGFSFEFICMKMWTLSLLQFQA